MRRGVLRGVAQSAGVVLLLSFTRYLILLLSYCPLL